MRNKEIIQSYLITSARYDFSVYEKRILYRIVEWMQGVLKGQPIGTGIRVQSSLFGDKKITMPISMFFLDTEEKRHVRIKHAFSALRKRGIDKFYPNGRQVGYPLIQYYDVTPQDGNVVFQISSELQDDLLDFAKGYSQYELQVAFSFRSQYTMRLYELTCKNKADITYTVARLREIFCLQDKYPDTYAFLRRVILPAEKELFESPSPTYFSFATKKTGKAITHLRFKTHTRTQAGSLNLLFEVEEEEKITKLLAWLNKHLGTSDKTWKPHQSLLRANLSLPKSYRKYNELDQILAGALDAKNPVGYVVNALKQRVADAVKLKNLVGKLPDATI